MRIRQRAIDERAEDIPSALLGRAVVGPATNHCAEIRRSPRWPRAEQPGACRWGARRSAWGCAY